MKTVFTVSTDAVAVAKVRALAAEVDAPIGDLVTLFLSYAIDRIKPEALKEWADKQVSRKGRLAGGLTKVERACITGIQALEAREGVRRFAAEDIAHAIGVRIAVAHDALNALKLRGLVGTFSLAPKDGPQFDKWGRELQTVWWLTDRPV